MSTLDEMPDILTVTEVAKYLTVSVITLKRWEKKGEMVFLRLGPRRDRRMKKADLIRFIDSKLLR